METTVVRCHRFGENCFDTEFSQLILVESSILNNTGREEVKKAGPLTLVDNAVKRADRQRSTTLPA